MSRKLEGWQATEMVSFTCSKLLVEEIEFHARNCKLSRSQYMRDAVLTRNAIENEKPDEEPKIEGDVERQMKSS